MYQKICFDRLPTVRFAHSYETERYRFHFVACRDFLEISYLEKGDVIREVKGGEKTLFAAPCLVIRRGEQECLMYSEAPVHRHVTVGLELPYESHPVTPSDVVDCCQKPLYKFNDGYFAIVADCVSAASGESDAVRLLRKIVLAHAMPDSSRKLLCAGLTAELLAEITRLCQRQCLVSENRIQSPGIAIYGRRAMQYIAAHLNRRITIGEVAGALEISAGYLSNVFREYTGQTLVEYINRCKLDKVRELMLDKGISMKEAGENLGFEDESYLSRLFRRYTGMSANELRRMKSRDEDHRFPAKAGDKMSEE